MKQGHFFGNAKWVGAPDRRIDGFSVLRGHFCITGKVTHAALNLLGLGFFKCYINGVCINPDTFLPLSSDFEASCDPVNEKITGHRVYVPQFDLLPYVKEGDNVIAVEFGGGWYTHKCRPFGLPKAIYRITVTDASGTHEHVSDERCRIGESRVSEYNFIYLERHNALNAAVYTDAAFDDTCWQYAAPVESLESEYETTACPTDALIRRLPVKLVSEMEGRRVYDCGENTTGYPVLRITAQAGETVRVAFSEELLPDNTLDPSHCHKQEYSVISDGCEREVQPEFTWFGFRYFEVYGNAEPLCVKEIHAALAKTSSFTCSNEVLNWTYHTFLHTMLCNMHTGHPSDCPHLERRGYTGDGQLTCHAVLTTLGAQDFYEKWMRDIGDCQDLLSGHVQYTAPYVRSGGGPGGWGCAIVEVPYQLCRHYANEQVLHDYYPQMRRYIDYLEAHSEFGLVTSDKAGEWCLGDWCGPNILYPDKDITSHNQQMLIPAPFVNTYFMIKSLEKMIWIARRIGKDADISEYEEKIALRKKALHSAYFNSHDGNYMMNAQGANAFAADLELGNAKTYPNIVNYYRRLGCYDTGIFGTDILTRILFEKGDADLAVDLLIHDGDQGFAHWMKNGATTLHEYWDSNHSRSHSHPMFGSPVAYFFEYLLGIRQDADSVGYATVCIEPMATHRFAHMEGSIQTPGGRLSVAYKRANGKIEFAIEIPSGTSALLRYGGCDYPLTTGNNTYSLTEK